MSIYYSGIWTVKAGGIVEINRRALFITCLAATAKFRMSIDGQPQSDFEKGLTYTADAEFNQVKIENVTNEPLQVEFGFGRGGVSDNRLVNGGNGFSVQVSNQPTVNIGGSPVLVTREKTVIRPILPDGAPVDSSHGYSFPHNTFFLPLASGVSGRTYFKVDANENRKTLFIQGVAVTSRTGTNPRDYRESPRIRIFQATDNTGLSFEKDHCQIVPHGPEIEPQNDPKRNTYDSELVALNTSADVLLQFDFINPNSSYDGVYDAVEFRLQEEVYV